MPHLESREERGQWRLILHSCSAEAHTAKMKKKHVAKQNKMKHLNVESFNFLVLSFRRGGFEEMVVQ